MKPHIKNTDIENKIFAAQSHNFTQLAIEVFNFQYQQNKIYRLYCDMLNITASDILELNQIPFLPIDFFKSQQIKTTSFLPQVVFESSGTTNSISSKHFVKDVTIYTKSFNNCFQKFYGDIKNTCILGLLPSYLERDNSSLVFMVDDLIKQSKNKLSGFYLDDFEKLHNTILHNEILKQPTLLIGVTYALLNFANQYTMQLKHTIVMETGGMKGKGEELTRQQVHKQLQNKLGLNLVHSEYGMTELLSQAYSNGNGIFYCPAWMKILVREEDDPFAIYEAKKNNNQKPITGAINVIDFANIYSCSFIATSDIGKLYCNNTFEVLGRLDNSDIRGCNLLAL